MVKIPQHKVTKSILLYNGLSSTYDLIHLNLAKVRNSADKSSIFVASEQRLDASAQASIQPAATKVTNIEDLSAGFR